MFAVGLDEFEILILYSQLTVLGGHNIYFLSNETKEIIFGYLLGEDRKRKSMNYSNRL